MIPLKNANRRQKIEILKAITAGTSVSDAIRHLLPDCFVVVDKKASGLFYEGQAISNEAFAEIVKQKSYTENVTVIQIEYAAKYGDGEALPVTNENQIKDC